MTCEWQPAPSVIIAGSDRVEVFRFSLEPPEERLRELAALLSADEQLRAARYRDAGTQLKFTAARGTLRAILSATTGKPAEAIRFGKGPNGKPFLENEFTRPRPEEGKSGKKTAPLRLYTAQPQAAVSLQDNISFNLAHSGQMGLIAVTRRREVGVDLETENTRVDAKAISGRFFAPGEKEALAALPPTAQIPGFFSIWTRKEALVKAMGLGLVYAFDSFSVSPTGEGPFRFELENRRWTLLPLYPAPEYYAALAVEGDAVPLRCWTWGELPMLAVPRRRKV